MTTVIAVDGPSGSGKSSTSRGVAKRLKFAYLDTGAMYRAATWSVLQAGLDPKDAEAVAQHIAAIDFASGTDPRTPTIAVNGHDVSVEIRSQSVTDAVSHVASVAKVRDRLVELQREIIADHRGIVVEGRDIGTHVAPWAQVKVFLVADAQARAARRASELAGDVQRTQQSLLERDAIDSSRAASPLMQAEDAVIVDGTHLTLAQVIDAICTLAQEAI